ncbi:MAG: hypothetical protein KBB32_10515 [Spirochaetia bacterium]|nr:hypothetical protein [Spirochaetia bacterium]
MVGKQQRLSLARISAGGDLAAWDPGVTAPATGFIDTIAVSEDTVYVGGSFTHIGSVARSNIAAIDLESGVPTAWNPGTNGIVRSIVVKDGNVYIGGSFTTAGGMARTNFAVIDATTGAATAAVMNATGGEVSEIVVNDEVLYMVGAFTNVGGQARNRAASVSISDWMVSPWNPNCSGQVNAVAVSEDAVYLGGDFSQVSAGATPRSRLAAVDKTDGVPLAWDPGCNGTVRDIGLDGQTLVACGRFNSAGGEFRSMVAAFDAATGELDPRLLHANEAKALGRVAVIRMDGGRVALGGDFTGAGLLERSNLAAFSSETCAIRDFKPDPDGAIAALEVGDGLVYAAGDFSSIGGRQRYGLAALDPVMGGATRFQADIEGSVLALHHVPGGLYAGGNFIGIISEGMLIDRLRLAKLDPLSGAPAGWDPRPDNSVRTLASRGDVLFAAGDFANMVGHDGVSVAKTRLAAFSLSTGRFAITSIPAVAGTAVYSLFIDGSTVYMAGLFTTVAGVARTNMAAFSAETGTLHTRVWSPNNIVYGLASNKGTLYMGGAFTTMGGVSAGRTWSTDLVTGSAGTWKPACSGTVYSTVVVGDRIWLGGSFSRVGAVGRSNIAAVRADGSVD